MRKLVIAALIALSTTACAATDGERAERAPRSAEGDCTGSRLC